MKLPLILLVVLLALSALSNEDVCPLLRLNDPISFKDGDYILAAQVTYFSSSF